MAKTDTDLLLLESMIGTAVSRTAGVQIAVDKNLPLPLPQSIHYELYKNHIELHVESSTYKSLCTFLEKNLPNNDIAKTAERSFCEYAYMLTKRVEGWQNIEELGNAIIELRNLVEPVLMQYCQHVAENIELAKALGDFYNEQEATLPFHINVIDELHANENAHTRILTHLLKYKEDGKHVILASFLKLLPTFDVDNFNIEKSKVYFNRDNIDGLIEKDGEYAVIIENKIHWAVDQDKQLERYVTTEIERGIPSDNIWVIYLTRDGRKKVEGYSLTKKTKEILGDRFLEMDYYHNILPWLKETVLPNCRVREEWLESAIKQYIDHLEGLFDMRDSRKSFLRKIQGQIAKSIGCTKEMSRSEVYDRLHTYLHTLGELQNIVGNSMDILIKPVIERLQNTTLEVLDELCPDEEIYLNNSIHNGYFQVLFRKWTTKVHFEWIPLNEKRLLSGTEYILVLHVEKNDILERFKLVLCDSLLMTKAAEVGLERDSKDNRVFYRKVISSKKSISDMTHEELLTFLQEAYKDVYNIQNFVSEYILNK
ncbi:MAG: PD-(D/E)XK nuclease family protein [Bacteroidales bacterium]|nr:PD-(D/E)XK nuclease family protein [Bacteroidales bacterium]